MLEVGEGGIGGLMPDSWIAGAPLLGCQMDVLDRSGKHAMPSVRWVDPDVNNVSNHDAAAALPL